MLDEADARVILLLAPAGYGKTTLARQWAKTLNGAIWIGLTPAHRDVATLAEDVANEVEIFRPGTAGFIRSFLQSRKNPQRSAREVALALAALIRESALQWIVLDDVHELQDAPEAMELMHVMHEQIATRFLLTSRIRPPRATARQVIYGELLEIGPDSLAMTNAEARALLGRRPNLEGIAERSQGWPALLSLAVGFEGPSPTGPDLPETLHRFLAEELFSSASQPLREALLELALIPPLSRQRFKTRFGEGSEALLDAAEELGFLVRDDDVVLHPLIREFLLAKQSDGADAAARVAAAIRTSVEAHEWDNALDLILRFGVHERFESVLSAAFKPLLRSGRVGSLARYASRVASAPTFPPPVVDLIEAEVALRDGLFDRSTELSERVVQRLSTTDPLRSRAAAIAGQSHFFFARFSEAEEHFKAAQESAQDDRDAAEAAHGLAVTLTFGERPGATEAVEALRARREDSPTDLVRHANADLSLRHFDGRLGSPLRLDDARRALNRVEDPLARTALTYKAAYAHALRAEYSEATDWSTLFFKDAEAFVLDFALPYANWTKAIVKLGLRRFGEAERAIQAVEDASSADPEGPHAVNARLLRARVCLQTGQWAEALAQVDDEPPALLIPSWRGEYLATRALALACLGSTPEAEAAARDSLATTSAAEARMLAVTARAVSIAQLGGDCVFALQAAIELGAWDSLLCGIRASQELAGGLAANKDARTHLEHLYGRSNDRALARRAGFRTRATKDPRDLLSPREREVLGLIAKGMRNREIAQALFIAESTTKVHVRHVLEKLGVRTRAEAVARYEMFARGAMGDASESERSRRPKDSS